MSSLSGKYTCTYVHVHVHVCVCVCVCVCVFVFCSLDASSLDPNESDKMNTPLHSTQSQVINNNFFSYNNS